MLIKAPGGWKQMTDQSSEIDLSPLDQIRQTEAEVTRKIAAARENAEQILKDARRQAAAIKQEASETGSQEGKARYRAIIAKTEEESRAIVAEAKAQARKLRRRGQERMQTGVSVAINFIIIGAENKKET
jgi:vacuolar-type H+-ATPase subunit H